VRSYFHNAICILLLTCSKSQPHADPTGSRHVAVWILYTIVLDAYLFVSYLVVQHNVKHNFKNKLMFNIYRPIYSEVIIRPFPPRPELTIFRSLTVLIWHPLSRRSAATIIYLVCNIRAHTERNCTKRITKITGKSHIS